MKVSAVLALRALASKIHSPLPLTPRESQQLLSLLTSSFREQLNREHPFFRADDGNAATESLVDGFRGKSIRLRSSVGASSARASSAASTDHHFRSILQNPLFAASTPRGHNPVPSISSTHHGDAPHHRTLQSDPMAWFEALVASGSAAITDATFAMSTLRKNLSRSADTSISHGMAASLAGSKVLRWLWSAGLQDSLDITKDAKFIALLTNYLVAEKRDDLIWDWIDRVLARIGKILHEFSAGQMPRSVQLAQRLLLELVKAELRLRNDTGAAVGHFLRLPKDQHLTEIEVAQSGDVKELPQILSSILAPTGRFLVFYLALNGGAEQLDLESLAHFIRNIAMWSKDADLYRARMHLHHPVTPSATAALAYLKKAASSRGQTNNPNKRRLIVHLSLDSATFLLQQELYSDATWVMDFLRKYYANELGILQGCQTSFESVKNGSDRIPLRSYDEISNLQLLARLDAC